MKVLLADSQSEIRSALKLLIEQELGCIVVGEAGKVDDLIAQAKSSRPDLILLDWHLHGARGATACKQKSALLSALHEICPHVKVIALSGRLEAQREAIAAGADAFVSKGDSPERLLEVLLTLCAGDISKHSDPIRGNVQGYSDDP